MLRAIIGSGILVLVLAACVAKNSHIDNAVASADIMQATVDTDQKPACPSNMAHVVGEWCPSVKLECEDAKSGARDKCIKYKTPICLSQHRIHKDFCMDRTEYVAPEERLPKVDVDFYQAEAICKNEGKRLCKESEFIFACSGEEMYPYTTGLERNCDKCNCDISQNLGPVEHRTDYRKSPEEIKECKSPFGIIGLNGNVDTMTVRDVSAGKYKLSLRGGHWMPIRARCLDAATVVHSELYSNNSAGFICCADSH